MDPLGFSVELAARGSVLLGLTALALLALRRAPAASRQAVAMAGIIGVLALTPLSLAMPRFDLVVLPPAVLEPGATPAHDATVRFLLGSSVALAWGVVAEIALARVALAMWRVARCARRGTELDDPGIARAAAKMGLRLPVRVVVSGEVEVPMTAGLQRPVILLPAPALEWSSERLELVLLHELAHVKRRDCLAMLLAEIAVASWWFHPLAWLARRSFRRNAEQAADDLVLSTGARPSVYAGHLLSIVSSLRKPAPSGPAVAMGRASDLDARLRALLEPQPRRPSPRLAGGMVAALAGLALIFSVVWPVHGAQPPPVCMRSLHPGHR